MRGTIYQPGSTTEWLEFFDPEDDEMQFRVNVSFLTSGYHCIFGGGCPGLLNRGVDFTRGCCERGARVVDDEDVANVERSISMLTEEDCDNLQWVREKGGLQKDKNGKPYKTKKKNGACIFRNTTPGREGCSFHVLGNRIGVNPADLKPDICWTVPLRSEIDWDTKHEIYVHVVSAWDADDWGGSNDSEEDDGRGHMGYWCVDEETEALTQRGWISGYDLTTDDIVLAMDPSTNQLRWSSVSRVFRKQYNGKMFRMTGNGLDALVTPEHKFVAYPGGEDSYAPKRRFSQALVRVDDLRRNDYLRLMGSALEDTGETDTDGFVQLVGWFVTEGSVESRGNHKRVTIYQREDNSGSIRLLLKRCGAEWSESVHNSIVHFRLRGSVVKRLLDSAPNKVMTSEFLVGLSSYQRELLIETMIDADGHEAEGGQRYFAQKNREATDAFVMLCALSGIATSTRLQHRVTEFGECDLHYVALLKRDTISIRDGMDFHGSLRDKRRKGVVNEPTVDYDGMVWCPTTEYGTFVARRNRKVYVTGNCIDTPDAYDGPEPVYVSHAYELKKIMGESGYNEMCRLFAERGYDQGKRPVGKMPGEVRNEGRPMLPLLIEHRS